MIQGLGPYDLAGGGALTQIKCRGRGGAGDISGCHARGLRGLPGLTHVNHGAGSRAIVTLVAT